MVLEDKGWVMYETTPSIDDNGNVTQQVSEATNIGETSDPLGTFNSMLSTKNASLKSAGADAYGGIQK